MASKITPQIKNKVWKDYTKDSKAKNELKQMFLGTNPTDAYKKISIKLKKKLDKVKTNESPNRKTLKPKRSNKSPSRKLRHSPSRKLRHSPSRKLRHSPSRKLNRSRKFGSPRRLRK